MSEPPQDFETLRRTITSRRSSLPRRLLQVADFALDRPQEVAFGRVADLARQAGVQPSTMVRFAQALGYAGFSDLQAVFLSRARTRWPEYRERLEALETSDLHAGDPAALLRGFMHAATDSIGRLAESINEVALQRAVTVLAGAQTIFLLGTRRAFPAVAYLAYALRRLAVPCQMVEQSAGLAPEQVALLGRADAVLAFSFTPYAPFTLELAAAAFQADVPVVAVTDGAFSPLTQSASVWLEVAEADHAAFRSLAGTFALASTLAVAVAARRGRL